LRRGTLEELIVQGDLLSFRRVLARESSRVVVNFSREPAVVSLSDGERALIVTAPIDPGTHSITIPGGGSIVLDEGLAG
jgi:hypothetical protein